MIGNPLRPRRSKRWLDSRDVTLDAFVEHLERRYWLRLSADAPSLIPAFDTASAERQEALRVDLMLTGELGRLAQALSRRVVASSIAQKSEAAGATEDLSEAHSRFLQQRGLQEWQVRSG
jgi:hypothetical protein